MGVIDPEADEAYIKACEMVEKNSNYDDIPMEEMQTAILDCYEAGGLSFKDMDEVFAHDFSEED